MNEFDLEEPINDEFDLEQGTTSLVVPNENIPEQPKEIKGLNTDITAPVAGYMAGKAAQEVISKTGELAEKGLVKAAGMLSPFSEEQLRYIKQNYPQYSKIEPTTAAKKLEAEAMRINQEAVELEKQAYKPLRDVTIKPSEYKELVLKTATEPDALGRSLARPLSQEVIEEVKKTADVGMASLLKKMDEQSLEEFADLKAKEAVDEASKKALGILPDDTIREISRSTKEKVMQNPQAFDFTPKRDIQKLMDEYFTLKDKGIIKESSMSDIFPELTGKTMTSSEERDLKKMLSMASKADMPIDELYNINQALSQLGYNPEGGIKSKVPAIGQKVIRGRVKELNPEASALFSKEGEKIAKLNALVDAGYIQKEDVAKKFDKDFIKLDKQQMNKIFSDLTNTDKDKLTPILNRIELLRDIVDPATFKELELAALKAIEGKDAFGYVARSPINKVFQVLEQPKLARMAATIPEALATKLPKLTTVGKMAVKALPTAGALAGGFAAQAAEQALESKPTGATPQMEEYWWERGVRDPEEQRQRAMLASFKEGLPAGGKIDEMPSAYEKPEIRQRKEQVMAAKKAGALAPTYVEAPKAQVLKADNPAEIASMAQALQSGQDKASQEYGRVLSQIVDAPAREKESILFGLNQQPAFRELVRKLKDQQKTEEETPLMLRGPA